MIIPAVALLFQVSPAEMPDCRPPYSQASRVVEATVPTVGAPSEAEVGEPILRASTYSVSSAGSHLTATLDIAGETSRKPFHVIIPAGTQIVYEGRGLYRPSQHEFTGAVRKPSDVHLDMSNPSAPRIRLSWGFIREVFPFSATDLKAEVVECSTILNDPPSRELVFTGVSRGVVSLEYREFAGRLARPAFTQTATYDLADGSTIGFRGGPP